MQTGRMARRQSTTELSDLMRCMNVDRSDGLTYWYRVEAPRSLKHDDDDASGNPEISAQSSLWRKEAAYIVSSIKLMSLR